MITRSSNKAEALFDLNLNMNQMSAESNIKRSNNIYIKQKTVNTEAMDQADSDEAENEERFRQLSTTKRLRSTAVGNRERSVYSNEKEKEEAINANDKNLSEIKESDKESSGL